MGICVRKEMGSDKDKKYIRYYFVLCTYHSIQLSHALEKKRRKKLSLARMCERAKVSLAMAKILIYFAFAFERLCLGTTRAGEKKRKPDKLLTTHAHRHMDMCLGQFQKISKNIILKIEPYDTS